MSQQTADDILDGEGSGERHPSFKFTNQGDTIRGTILENRAPDVPVPGGGSERVPLLVVVDDNGETWSLWLNSFRMRDAVKQARNAAGETKLKVGGRIAVRFVDNVDVGKPSPAKTYAAQYQAPVGEEASTVTVDDLL